MKNILRFFALMLVCFTLVTLLSSCLADDLETTRELYDISNIRYYHYEIFSALLHGELDFRTVDSEIKLYDGRSAAVTTALEGNGDGTFVVTVIKADSNQYSANWQSGDQQLHNITIPADANFKDMSLILYTFTYTADTETDSCPITLTDVSFDKTEEK